MKYKLLLKPKSHHQTECQHKNYHTSNLAQSYKYFQQLFKYKKLSNEDEQRNITEEIQIKIIKVIVILSGLRSGRMKTRDEK